MRLIMCGQVLQSTVFPSHTCFRIIRLLNTVMDIALVTITIVVAESDMTSNTAERNAFVLVTLLDVLCFHDLYSDLISAETKSFFHCPF